MQNTNTDPLLSLGIEPSKDDLFNMGEALGIPSLYTPNRNANHVYGNMQLIGRPIPMTFSQMAKSDQTVVKLPAMAELIDPTWLVKNYYSYFLKSIEGKTLFSSLKEKIQGNGICVSDISLQAEKTNVFVHEAMFADYAQALQFVSTPTEAFSIGGNYDVGFNEKGIDWAIPMRGSSCGIGAIINVIKEIDFKKHFSSPGEMKKEMGEGFDTLEGGNFIKSRMLFEEYLQQDFIDAVLNYSKESGYVVKGFVCSYIKMNTKLTDSITRIGTSSKGTLQMAFTLLM